MKLSYNWVKKYLPLKVSAEDLGEKIERTAVEVDSVTQPCAGLKKIIVGQIISFEPHPDSDHLNVCQVDVGEDEPLQIVCGAPNVEKGKKVIVAIHGARVAGNVKIKRSKMRGIQSNGMLCALDEIGIDKECVPDEWSDGIYFLPDDAKLGDEVYKYLGMDDKLIDLDVTPNRGDMLSLYGSLHEIAAIYDLPLKLDSPQLSEDDVTATPDQISADVNNEIAKTYKLRVINGVKIQPSPLWLQIILWNADIKPINNVVDVTNYIMLKYGQPLHAYDANKISGKHLSVRFAKNGEKITTLDDKERILDDKDTIISDDQKPLALAGIIGGKDSEITNNTTDVTLEAAVFDPINIRKTARQHVLHTEASQRFERGVNHAGVQEALDAAAEMIQKLAQGKVAPHTLTAIEDKPESVEVNTKISRINAVLGTKIPATEIDSIFKRLGFNSELNGDDIKVIVPPRRWDIHIPADLFEEVARIYGYDNLPVTLPNTPLTIGSLTTKQKSIRRIRNLLEGAGLTHAISYALTTVEKAKMFLMLDTYETNLDFPMSSEHTTLRMNLVTGLLDDIAYNQARGVDNVALYEQGRVFYKDSKDQVRPSEIEHIAGAITGSLVSDTWHVPAKKVDFYQLKGIADLLLNDLDIKGSIEYKATIEYPDMHPGRTADVYIHGHKIGFIGEIHPSVANKFNIKDTYVFDFDLDELLNMPAREQQYQIVSKYPSVSRDIALVVSAEVTDQQIVDVINKRGGAFLTNIHLFDVYEGKNIESGKKSMAYSLTYQNKRDTLTDNDVNKAFDKVQRALKDAFDAEIR